MVFAAIFPACIWKKKKKKKKTSPPHSQLPPTTVDSSWSFHPRVQLSMDEIAKATDNFLPDFIIGKGSFGLVYKARLSSGLKVAVKKLSPDAFHHGFREFQAEVKTLGKIRHRNIVKILGSLASGLDRFLVYEFMERRSLDLWLHHPSTSIVAINSLSWETRVKIVRGVANGLRYLHGLEKPIIHRDIKPSKVLLDSQFEAHISDFGLARIIGSRYSQVSTQPAGSLAYMAPECKTGISMASAKIDVYSFGVLILETATGRGPDLPVISGNEKLSLLQWAKKLVAQNNQTVDPIISNEDGISVASVKEYVRIACMCCSELQKDRPTMAEVVDLLDRMPM